MHESNGLGIITALILNDINPLGKVRLDLVLELKNNASKLLLAIMESRSSDPENVAEKIIYNMNPKQLIDVACKAYHQEILDEDEDDEDESNNDDGSGEQPRYLQFRGCQIGMQWPQLCSKARHFCKLDVATSRMAFLDLNMHVY